MINYSPFSKGIDQLTADDLESLKTVKEGWYVEYKRELVDAAAIAKSISAFANTYGGWLFYGIGEKDKNDSVADDFRGIVREDVDKTLQRIRQAAATLLAPSPHFVTQALWGPSKSIGLIDDRAIICVHVPWSPTAPHVHKDGRIYRRVSDGSEPKPENDRFVLDQLWNRAKDIREGYKEWLDRDPELSESESETPYLRLLMVADLWGQKDLWTEMSMEDFRSVINRKDSPVANLVFDTIYTSANGFIARQTVGNDPRNLSLTWRFKRNFSSEIIIPLKIYRIHDLRMLEYELNGFKYVKRLKELSARAGFKSIDILDLNFLYSIFVVIANIQERLAETESWKGPFFAKARLLNVWRTCPFIDVDAVLDVYEQHGIPMCIDRNMTILPSADPDTFFEVESHLGQENAVARAHVRALTLFNPVATALGVPGWINFDGEKEELFFPTELQNACDRAVKVQENRNKRS